MNNIDKDVMLPPDFKDRESIEYIKEVLDKISDGLGELIYLGINVKGNVDKELVNYIKDKIPVLKGYTLMIADSVDTYLNEQGRTEEVFNDSKRYTELTGKEYNSEKRYYIENRNRYLDLIGKRINE